MKRERLPSEKAEGQGRQSQWTQNDRENGAIFEEREGGEKKKKDIEYRE